MKKVSEFYIKDKFVITGKGIVFVGHILNGVINKGNYIEFGFYGDLIKRKIIGIEFVTHSIHNEKVFDRMNTGVFIECKNEEEIKKIKDSTLEEVEVLIFEE